MARTPVASTQLPSGSIRFQYDDGSFQDSPPTDYASQLHAALPDRLAGATAGIEDLAKAALSGQQPSTVASDFGSGLAVNTAPTGPTPAGSVSTVDVTKGQPTTTLEATAANALAGGATPAGGRFRSAADRALEAELSARRVGLSTQPVTPGGGEPEFGDAKPPEPPKPRGYYVAPRVLDPGGRTPASWTVQNKQYDPSVRENLNEALDSENLAAQMRMVASREEEDRKIKQAVATQEALRYEQEQMQKAAAQRMEQRKAAEEQIRRSVDEVSKQSINPEAYWESKSGFQKVMLALALGITNAAGMPGLQNMINQRIRDNIDAQKANREAKVGAISGKVNVYNMMLERFGDEKLAEQATYSAYLDRIAKQAEINAARFEQSDPIRAAKSMELASAFARQKAELDRQLTEATVTQHDINAKPVISPGGWVGPKNDTIDPNDPTAGMSKKDAEMYRKLTEDLNEHVGAMADINSAIDAVKTSGGAGTGIYGSRAPSWGLTTEGNRVRGKITNAIGRYGKAVYGAMTADEFARARETAVGSGTAEETVNGLDTLRNGVRATVNSELRKYPAHLQEAYRRANPQLFESETKTRNPGQ